MSHRKHGDKYALENDSEHSYNLAMTAWYLSRWFPELDKNKLIQYALVHDLVEIHAGDTYIYADQKHLDSKKEREAKALEKLKQDWDDFSDLGSTIEDYEKHDNNESKFIYALDKIMPIMLIYVSDGHSWKEHGVTVKMLYDAKIEKVSLSPEIKPYFDQLHSLLLEHPELIKKR